MRFSCGFGKLLALIDFMDEAEFKYVFHMYSYSLTSKAKIIFLGEYRLKCAKDY